MNKLKNEPKGIQSLEIGCGILEKIAYSDQPMTISEIARVCEMSASKVHHYLVSFCRVGFLDKGADGKYHISAKLMMLGLTKENHSTMKRILKPHVEAFCRSINETASLSFWGQDGPYVALQEKCDKSISLSIKEGSIMSLVSSANGKLFAAFYTPDKILLLLEKELSELGINKDEFISELNKIRENGYSVVEGDYLPGISCIAAPIYNKDKEMVGALSTIGISGLINLSPNSSITLNTVEQGKNLSRILGCPI